MEIIIFIMLLCLIGIQKLARFYIESIFLTSQIDVHDFFNIFAECLHTEMDLDFDKTQLGIKLLL